VVPGKFEIRIEEILKGKKQAIAGALNLLESRRPENFEYAKELIEKLSRSAKLQRHVIGITGPPGVGKSKLISRIVEVYRAQKKTIGIISVDPSSRRSGGALLGDRSQIFHDPNDQGIFIRSMAAGRHLGGLAWRTRHCLTVFEAVYDEIIIETVGVGQSETEIDQVVDTVAFVIQPGSGDALQFMKAGIMEIPHVLVVNKADQKTLAMRALNDLKAVASFSRLGSEGWENELVLTSALEGWGQKELVEAMEKHRGFLDKDGVVKLRRRNRVQWINMLFRERFGTFGIEMLGGEPEVIKQIERTDIANPFEGMQYLTEEMWKKVDQRLSKEFYL